MPRSEPRSEHSSRFSRAPPRNQDCKPFGATIITRPQFLSMQDDNFRVYTLNPEIIKSYTKDTTIEKALIPFLEPPHRGDIRILQDVNEVRIRNTSSQVSLGRPKGTCENWWMENESGNEFFVVSDMWKRVP